jgi:DNA-binding Lrp family transcriptional regulator
VVDELGETAERVLQFIQNNPGCHLRKIKEMIQISQGTVQYHTDRLEKIGRITPYLTEVVCINIILPLEFSRIIKRKFYKF